jgi:hypothetical protein
LLGNVESGAWRWETGVDARGPGVNFDDVAGHLLVKNLPLTYAMGHVLTPAAVQRSSRLDLTSAI